VLPDLLELYDVPDRRRLVRGGMVLSADGGAVHDGSSRPLSTPADRAVFRALRAVSDVVLVGAGTARVEGYGPLRLSPEQQTWRTQRGRPPLPALAVVSRSLDLPERLLEVATVVTCASSAHEGLRDPVVAGQDRVDLAGALDQLAARGLRQVLCEGGPDLLGELVGAGLLDELCATLSPHLVGRAPGLLGAPLAAPVPLRLLHVLEDDGSLLLRWSLGPAD